LVEHRERVTHTSVGFLRNHVESSLFRLHVFSRRDVLKMPYGIVDGYTRKIIYLTSGKNGWDYLLLFSSSKDKYDIAGWFFQRFQKSIESGRAQHMNLVYDENLVPTERWRYTSLVYQCADIVYGIVRSGV
jgi:hypothetical protein